MRMHACMLACVCVCMCVCMCERLWGPCGGHVGAGKEGQKLEDMCTKLIAPAVEVGRELACWMSVRMRTHHAPSRVAGMRKARYAAALPCRHMASPTTMHTRVRMHRNHGVGRCALPHSPAGTERSSPWPAYPRSRLSLSLSLPGSGPPGRSCPRPPARMRTHGGRAPKLARRASVGAPVPYCVRVHAMECPFVLLCVQASRTRVLVPAARAALALRTHAVQLNLEAAAHARPAAHHYGDLDARARRSCHLLRH